MAEKDDQEYSFNDEEIEEVKASVVPSDESKIEVTEEDFSHFTGKNADKYLPKFKKFNVDGVDKFAVTWHWPAVFFTFFWMLYRKLYLWALFVFVFLKITAYLALLAAIIFGMTANYIYYKHAKRKIIRYKTANAPADSSQSAIALRKIGGVNRWAAVLAVI